MNLEEVLRDNCLLEVLISAKALFCETQTTFQHFSHLCYPPLKRSMTAIPFLLWVNSLYLELISSLRDVVSIWNAKDTLLTYSASKWIVLWPTTETRMSFLRIFLWLFQLYVSFLHTWVWASSYPLSPANLFVFSISLKNDEIFLETGITC